MHKWRVGRQEMHANCSKNKLQVPQYIGDGVAGQYAFYPALNRPNRLALQALRASCKIKVLDGRMAALFSKSGFS